MKKKLKITFINGKLKIRLFTKDDRFERRKRQRRLHNATYYRKRQLKAWAENILVTQTRLTDNKVNCQTD